MITIAKKYNCTFYAFEIKWYNINYKKKKKEEISTFPLSFQNPEV